MPESGDSARTARVMSRCRSLLDVARKHGAAESVDIRLSVPDVWGMLDRNQSLTGLLVCDGARYVTAVTRRFLSSRLLHRYGREVFARKPLAFMLKWEMPSVLELPGDVSIIEAATIAVGASRSDLERPIVVSLGVPSGGGRVLLDSRLLLHEAMMVARQVSGDLERERTAAERASNAKSEFLANMSHELRTPMTAILGYADLMLDPTLTPDDRTLHLATVRRNGELLLALINDILDISKIEAGRMTVEEVATDPAQIAREVQSLLNVRAVAKGVLLRVEVAPDVPAIVASDPRRLHQILLNLVGNAVKFTDTGSVVLRCRVEQAGEARLRFDIEDTGIGMSREQLGAIFRPFTQADSSMSRRYGGTGLGLAISGRLASLLGGGISVESRPGAGSTFTLTLPMRPAAARSGAEPSTSKPRTLAGDRPLAGRRVLLAEDSPDNQRLIMHHLRKWGVAAVCVENGRLAVDAVCEAAVRNNPFELVLMDMQMPELDGYGAASLLRAKGWRGPIIALTAHAMAGDRERCIAAGCDDYLTKPIDPVQLAETCARWAGSVNGDPSAAAA